MTLPGAVAAVELGGAAVLAGGLGAGEAIGRLAGFTEYGGDIITASHMRSSQVLSQYFGDHYTDAEIKDQEKKLTAAPKTGWNYLDRAGYVTLPGAVAAVELGGAALLGAAFATTESLGRVCGISARSKALFSVMASCVGNMYGAADVDQLEDKKRSVTAPVTSYWNVCDAIGMVPGSVISFGLNWVAAIPAIIGFNQANWHRFHHFRHQLANNINERRKGAAVDRTSELHYKAELDRCEKLSNVSKYNIFNAGESLIEGTARYILAPLAYGTIRLIKNHFFGLVPLIKHLGQCVNPTRYELRDPFDRVKKRFADLKKALDKDGHLSGTEGVSDLHIKSVEEALQTAEQRKWYERAGFSIYSETRKILSLGHTVEEKVLSEFKHKFEEFTRACKRAKKVNANSFFKEDIRLPNGQRFSYEAMVAHIEGAYVNQDDKQQIRRIAALIRGDIEKEMGMVPSLSGDSSRSEGSETSHDPTSPSLETH